ncbi:hypothetical protein SAMN06296036_101378 [Pseudobacteriovorax antillogorgiicola]|uniref:Uncharacterized protein n=1 Tax=Pseudobacteriovorax antillogorgiicola TaxID=1513793 RepID=A0A1Y6B5F1_9BACT|nr:hypothetical protein EDD56_101108 [Pseudobacteriovorax antillogorgiicola]SME90586.1 hypothetical protein SAMN06296036_101378 [Pseudobacteriovorax antillogorgiicola]
MIGCAYPYYDMIGVIKTVKLILTSYPTMLTWIQV